MTKIVMPKTGAEMEEGRIVAWRRSEGEPVRKGEVLLEIETDKAIMEVESPTSGILLKRLYAEGQTVPATCLIAVLGDGSEAAEQIGEFIQSEVATPLPQPRAVSPHLRAKEESKLLLWREDWPRRKVSTWLQSRARGPTEE